MNEGRNQAANQEATAAPPGQLERRQRGDVMYWLRLEIREKSETGLNWFHWANCSSCSSSPPLLLPPAGAEGAAAGAPGRPAHLHPGHGGVQQGPPLPLLFLLGALLPSGLDQWAAAPPLLPASSGPAPPPSGGTHPGRTAPPPQHLLIVSLSLTPPLSPPSRGGVKSPVVCSSFPAGESYWSYWSHWCRLTQVKWSYWSYWCRLIQYPAPPCKGRITVTREDLACLGDGEFLNDVIIDFYLKSVHDKFTKTMNTQRYVVLRSAPGFPSFFCFFHNIFPNLFLNFSYFFYFSL